MPIVDRAIAQNVLSGLPASVVSVVLNGFELDVRRLTRTMSKAANAGDFAAYRHAAYALADTASNLGATDLALAARTASQRAAAEPDLSLVLAAESAIGEMKAVCARFGQFPQRSNSTLPPLQEAVAASSLNA